jgi:hypothetical protein
LKQGYNPPRPEEATAHVSFDLAIDRDGDEHMAIDNLLWLAGAVTNNALTLVALERSTELTLAARYGAGWFSHARVEDMLQEWLGILQQAVAAPKAPLSAFFEI